MTKRGESRDHTPKRVPVSGNRNVLTVNGKEDGFYYRWVLDAGDRINRFKRAGYEVVTHEVEVGDARVGTASPVGSPVTASNGGGSSLILMRIPLEYYEEDQKAKMDEVDALEASMGKNVDGQYGKLDISRGR